MLYLPTFLPLQRFHFGSNVEWVWFAGVDQAAIVRATHREAEGRITCVLMGTVLAVQWGGYFLTP